MLCSMARRLIARRLQAYLERSFFGPMLSQEEINQSIADGDEWCGCERVGCSRCTEDAA